MVRKKAFIIILIVLIIAGGVIVFVNYSSSPKTLEKTIPTLVPTKEPMDIPKQTSLEGEVVCLPHKDTSGPQTLECAIGLKAKDGNYYALDSGNTTPPPYNTGDKIRANGLITPIEQLSSDHWQKYNVKGIFSIKDGFDLLQ